jgi:hypothetical protein
VERRGKEGGSVSLMSRRDMSDLQSSGFILDRIMQDADTPSLINTAGGGGLPEL